MTGSLYSSIAMSLVEQYTRNQWFKLHQIHLIANWFWGYFVSYKELVKVFLDAGGIFTPTARSHEEHARPQARRCIFKYLMPGHIQITLNYLDGVCGLTFIVGPDDIKLDGIDKRLRSRCRDMFLRDPDQYMYTDDPDVYTLEKEGLVHQLEYLDDVECDETADWYCLEIYHDQLRKKATKVGAESNAQAKAEAASQAPKEQRIPELVCFGGLMVHGVYFGLAPTYSSLHNWAVDKSTNFSGTRGTTSMWGLVMDALTISRKSYFSKKSHTQVQACLPPNIPHAVDQASIPLRSKMALFFWAYFVPHKELVEIFLDAGGELDALALLQDGQARYQAWQAIFSYLMPGCIRTTLNVVDGICGFTFIVGPDDVELEYMGRRFLSRCWDNPERFTFERDGRTHILKYLDYIDSDRTAKWYYEEKRRRELRAQKKAAQAKAKAHPEAGAQTEADTDATAQAEARTHLLQF
ncbi:hypothetical protein BDV93DRAFT_513249 [Ceratobasidium sp. AG-I]|nr:hypothetical protein BDV93DRAFT_513249 [Ceratobasidium sp. AG-I]